MMAFDGRQTEAHKERVTKRMEIVDQLPPDVRRFVHEFGWNITKEFMAAGIKNPKTMKHLINIILGDMRPPEVENERIRANESLSDAYQRVRRRRIYEGRSDE